MQKPQPKESCWHCFKMFPSSQVVKLPTPHHLETSVKQFCSVGCKDAWIKSESKPCARCQVPLFKQSSLAKCKMGVWYCSDKCAFNLNLNKGGGWSTTAQEPPKREEQEWQDDDEEEEELNVEDFVL